MKRIFLIVVSTLLIFTYTGINAHVNAQSGSGWKAGVARKVITPEEPMWLAGYGSRDHESEGKLHDLWAKALAFEDAKGNKGVLVTSDILGFPKNMSDEIRDLLASKYDLSKAQVILNSSHTHSGPALKNSLPDVYPVNNSQQKRIDLYTEKLTGQIVELVGEALNNMQTVNIYAENGVTRFQINRRNNDAATLDSRTDLNGPNDYAVPVIKVEKKNGDLLAVAFGYACHPTVLSIYHFSGDYPGFAQIELEKSYPGVTAMFFQGAGADQNPLPRRTIPLAEQYGKELAAAVERVLHEEMIEIEPSLSTAYSEVTLELTTPPAKDELAKMAEKNSGSQKRWAQRLHGKLERGEPLETKYPYPVQVWNFGNLPIVTLGGELLIDYSIKLKEILGQDIIVMGYTNDVMSYIPSVRVLREGGYEGDRSQMVYGLPSKWKGNIETLIIHEALKTAQNAGITVP